MDASTISKQSRVLAQIDSQATLVHDRVSVEGNRRQRVAYDHPSKRQVARAILDRVVAIRTAGT